MRVNTLQAHPSALTLRRLESAADADRSFLRNRRAWRERREVAVLASAKRGERVTVWTEPATVTPQAQAGKAGVISADRIVLPPS